MVPFLQLQHFCMWFHLCTSVFFIEGWFFLVYCMFVHSLIFVLVYPIVMGHSFCFVVFVCGTVYATVFYGAGLFFLLCVVLCLNMVPSVHQMGHSSCCVVMTAHNDI